MSTSDIWIAVVLAAVITLICRTAPFVLARGHENSRFLTFLSATMPLGVMVVLIAYTVSGTGSDLASWAPTALGIAATVGLHLWRRSVALSLVGGTAVYVLASLALA